VVVVVVEESVKEAMCSRVVEVVSGHVLRRRCRVMEKLLYADLYFNRGSKSQDTF